MRKPLCLKQVVITFLDPKHGWVYLPVVLEKFDVPRRQRERRLAPPHLHHILIATKSTAGQKQDSPTPVR